MWQFFVYLKAVIDANDSAASHRFALVGGVLSMGPSTVLLSIAAAAGADVAVELATVTGALAGLSGFVYNKAKQVESNGSV